VVRRCFLGLPRRPTLARLPLAPSERPSTSPRQRWSSRLDGVTNPAARTGTGIPAREARAAGVTNIASMTAAAVARAAAKRASLGLLWVRVGSAVAAAQRLPAVGTCAVRARGQALNGLDAELVAAVRATVGACGYIAANGDRIGHDGSPLGRFVWRSRPAPRQTT
jgi:hypothetical protein